MPATIRSRKADSKGRVVLFADFANASVVIERISDDEIRIRKKKAVPRFSLETLLEGITATNLHREVDDGGPVGNEVL
jgi:antitoxin component of MazEF toxin-antitoxin module